MPLTENYLGTLNKKQKKSSTQDYLAERYGQLGGNEPDDSGSIYDFMGSALWGAAAGLSWGASGFLEDDDYKWENMNPSQKSGYILGEGLSLMAPVVGPFSLLGKGSRLAVKGSNKFVGKAVQEFSEKIVKPGIIPSSSMKKVLAETAEGALGKTIVNSESQLAGHITKEIGKMTDDAATGVRWINQMKGSVDDVAAAHGTLTKEVHSIVKGVFKKAGHEVDDNVVRGLSTDLVDNLGSKSGQYVNDISELVTRGLLNKFPNMDTMWMGENIAKYAGMAANDMAIMTMHGMIAGKIKEQSKDEEFSTTSTLGHSALMSLMFPLIRKIPGGGSDRMSTGIKGFFSRFKKTNYDSLLAKDVANGTKDVQGLLKIMIEGEGKAVHGSSAIKDAFWKVGDKSFSGRKLVDAIDDGTMTGGEAVSLLKKMNTATSKEFMRLWKPEYIEDLGKSTGRMAVGVLATNSWIADPDAWGELESSELASHIFMSAIMTKSRGHWGKSEQTAYFNKLSPLQNLSARMGLSDEKLTDFIRFHNDADGLVGLGATSWNTKAGKQVYKPFDEAKAGKADPSGNSFEHLNENDKTLLHLQSQYNMMGQFKEGDRFQPIDVMKLSRENLDSLYKKISGIELETSGGKTIGEVGYHGALVEITNEVALAGERVYKNYLKELSDVLGLEMITNDDGGLTAKFITTDKVGQNLGVLSDVSHLVKSMESLNMINAYRDIKVEDAFESYNKKRVEQGEGKITFDEYTGLANDITNKWMQKLDAEYGGKLKNLNKLQEGNPFWEHIVNNKFVKASNSFMMIASGSGHTEKLQNATKSIDKFFMVPNGKNEYYDMESMRMRIPDYMDYQEGKISAENDAVRFTKVQEALDVLKQVETLVGLRRLSTNGQSVKRTSDSKLKADELNTIKNIFAENFGAEGLPAFLDQTRVRDMLTTQLLNVKGFDKRAYRAAGYLIENDVTRINSEGKIEMISREAVIESMKADKNTSEDIARYEKARDTLENVLGKDNIVGIDEVIREEARQGAEGQNVLNPDYHISEVVKMAELLNSQTILDLQTVVPKNLNKLKEAGGGKFARDLEAVFKQTENVINSFNTENTGAGKVTNPVEELAEVRKKVVDLTKSLEEGRGEASAELLKQINEMILRIDTISESIKVENQKWELSLESMVETSDGQLIKDMDQFKLRQYIFEPFQQQLLRMSGEETHQSNQFEKIINSLINGDKSGLSLGSIQKHTNNLIRRFHDEVFKGDGRLKTVDDLIDYVRDGKFAFSEIKDILNEINLDINREVISNKRESSPDRILMIDNVQQQMDTGHRTKTLIEIGQEAGFTKDGKIPQEFKDAVLADHKGEFKEVEKYIYRRYPDKSEADKKWKEFKDKHAINILNAFDAEVKGTSITLEVMDGATSGVMRVNENAPEKRFASVKWSDRTGVVMGRLQESIVIIDKDGVARKVNLSTYNNVDKIQDSLVHATRVSQNAEADLTDMLRWGEFGETEITKFIASSEGGRIGSEPIAYVRLSPNDKMVIPLSDKNLIAITRAYDEFVKDYNNDPNISGANKKTFNEYMKSLNGKTLDSTNDLLRSTVELKVLFPYLDGTGKRSELVKLFDVLSPGGAGTQQAIYKIQANIFKRGFLSDGGTTTPISIKANDYISENLSGLPKSQADKIRNQGYQLKLHVFDENDAESWVDGIGAKDQHQLNNRKTVDRNYQSQIDVESSKRSPDKALISLIRQSQLELAESGSLISSRFDGVKYASESLMAYVMANRSSFDVDFIKGPNGAKTIIAAVGRNQLLGKGYLIYDPSIAREMGDSDIAIGTSAAKTLWGDSFQRGVPISPQKTHDGLNLRAGQDKNKMYINLDELSASFTSTLGGKTIVPSSQFDWQSPHINNQWVSKSKFAEKIVELSLLHGNDGKITTDVMRRLMDVEVENGNPLTDEHTMALKLVLEFGGNSELPYISQAVNRFASNFIIKNVGKNMIETGSDFITAPDALGTLENPLHINLYDKNRKTGDAYERIAIQHGAVGVGKSSTHRPIGTTANALQGELLIIRDENGVDWTVMMEGRKGLRGVYDFQSAFYDKMKMVDGDKTSRKIENTTAKGVDENGKEIDIKIKDMYDSGAGGGKDWRRKISNSLDKLNEIATNNKLSYSQVHELMIQGHTQHKGSTIRLEGGNNSMGSKLWKPLKDAKIQFGMLNTAIPSLGKDQVIHRVQRINEKMNGLMEVNVQDLRTIMQRDNDGDHVYSQTKPDKAILRAFLLEQGKIADFPAFSKEVMDGVKTFEKSNPFGLDIVEGEVGRVSTDIGYTKYASQIESQQKAIGTFIGQRGALTWASRMGLTFTGEGGNKLLKNFWDRADLNTTGGTMEWLQKFMFTAQASVDYHGGKLPIFDTTEILLDFVLDGRLSDATKKSLLSLDKGQVLSKLITEEADIFSKEPFSGKNDVASLIKSKDMQRKSLKIIFSTLKRASMVSNDTWEAGQKRTPFPHEFEKAYLDISQLLNPKTSTRYVAEKIYRQIQRETDYKKRHQLEEDFLKTFFKDTHLRSYNTQKELLDNLIYSGSESWVSLKPLIKFDGVKGVKEGTDISIPGNMLSGLMETKFSQSSYGGVSTRTRSQVALQESIGTFIDNLEYSVELSQYRGDAAILAGKEPETIDLKQIHNQNDINVQRAIRNGFIDEILQKRIIDLKKSLNREVNDSFPSNGAIHSLKRQIGRTEASVEHMDKLRMESFMIEEGKSSNQIQRGDGNDLNLGWLKSLAQNNKPKVVGLYRLSDKAMQGNNHKDLDGQSLAKGNISYFDLEFMGNKTSRDVIKKQKGFYYLIEMEPMAKFEATENSVKYGQALSRLTMKDVQAVEQALDAAGSYDNYSIARNHLIKSMYAVSIQGGQKAKSNSVFKKGIYKQSGTVENGFIFNTFINEWLPKLEMSLGQNNASARGRDALELLISDLIAPSVSPTKYTTSGEKQLPVFQTNSVMLDNVFKHLMDSKVGRTDIMRNLVSEWELTKLGKNPDDLRADIYFEQGNDVYDWSRISNPDPIKSMLQMDGVFYSDPMLNALKQDMAIHPTFTTDKKVAGRITQVRTLKKKKVNIFSKESGGC